jgi:hypothetical protein
LRVQACDFAMKLVLLGRVVAGFGQGLGAAGDRQNCEKRQLANEE